MAAFVEEYGLGGFEHIADDTGRIWATFGVTAQPTYIFIGDDGAIARQVGSLEPDAFDDVLEQLRSN